MAYTPTVSKISVVKNQGHDDFTVTINITVLEDTTEVFNKNYSLNYNSNTTIGDIQSAFQTMIVNDWDIYLDEKDIFEHTAFDNLISNLQTAASTYMNP